MATLLTTQQRDRLLQEADPAYLDVLREQWQQTCTENRLLSAESRLQYLEETAIPQLLTGNIVLETGQYAYAGPLDRLDDALEKALATPARGTRQRYLLLLIPALVLVGLLVFLLQSSDDMVEPASALGSGDCAGDPAVFGSGVRPSQPLFVAIDAADATLLFCVINVEGDKQGVLKETPAADDLVNNVAWMTDTWVRPVFGVDARLIDAISSGDRITLRSGSSAARVYTASVVYAADRRQAAELLDQAQKPGLLLFSLPSDGDTVQVVEGIADEQVAAPAAYPVGQPFTYRDVAVSNVVTQVREGQNGSLLVTVSATLTNARATPAELVVRFADSDGIITYPQDSGVVQIQPQQAIQSTWTFLLPDMAHSGAAIAFVEGDATPAYVLFDVAPPAQQYALQSVSWDAVAQEVIVSLTVSSNGHTVLEPDELRIVQQGGDVAVRTDKVLPLTVSPEAPVTIVARFRPIASLATILTEGEGWLELSQLPLPVGSGG